MLITSNVPIRLRVNFNGYRIDIQTGFRVDLSKWDKEKEKVRNGVFNKYGQSSSDINSGIIEIKLAIQDLFRSCETLERLPTKEEIKQTVKEVRTKGKLHEQTTTEIDFFNAFDSFVKKNGRLNNWSKATFTKFSAVKNHLKGFNSNLTFDVFDENGLSEYLIFLRKKKEMRNSTIKKQLGFLKWFLRWGFENHYHKNDAYKAFRPKIKDAAKTIIFLTEDEKKKILEVKLPSSKEYLQRVRDVLMFTCYSGLRYSDVFNLKRSDIKKDHIMTTTVKTTDSLVIELNKHTKSILEKYQDIPYKDNKALPVISNQKMNDYLKELGELAGIDDPIRQTYYVGNERIDNVIPKYELLGTHVGRRTFICSALAIGIPVQVVMKWTGHSDYKAMKPYIDITDKTKQNAMEKFNLL